MMGEIGERLFFAKNIFQLVQFVYAYVIDINAQHNCTYFRDINSMKFKQNTFKYAKKCVGGAGLISGYREGGGVALKV